MISRLSSIFRGDDTYLNREITVPAELSKEPLFENEILFQDPALNAETRSLLRVIVHPNVRDIQGIVNSGVVKILESPYECGRVLESPNMVEIGGIPYALTVKGVGATQFFRQTQAIAPWHWRGRDLDVGTSRAMKTRTYHEYRGTFHSHDAEDALKGYRLFEELGIETEIPLAIWRLASLPDKNGEMRPIADLKKRRHLSKGTDPVLYVRATKTNFRVLDPIRMNETESLRPNIAPLFAHMLAEYRLRNDPTASIQDYVEWLFEKIFDTEARLSFAGITHGGEMWSDFWRNWSLLGEILDLDDTERYEFEDPGFYRLRERLKRRMGLVFSNLRFFLDALLFIGETVDFNRLAERVCDTLSRVCETESAKLQSQYDAFPEYHKFHKNVPSLKLRFLTEMADSPLNFGWLGCHESNHVQTALKSRFQKKYGIEKAS